MSSVRDAIHQHHSEIADRLAAQLDALEHDKPDADPTALVTFLEEELVPHAHGEEAYLYPAVDPLISRYGSPTATMRVDHEYLSAYVDRLREMARAWANSTPQARPALLRQAARLALQLQTLLQVHLEKEERIYLPLFERYLPAAEQQRILDAMHESPDEA